MPDSLPSPASLPRPLRIGAIALAAVLLTSFFIYLGFPYDRLASRISAGVERGTGVRLSYGPVTASPQIQGPGIRVADLRARTRRGESWDFTTLLLRPAWSPSWLAAEPAVYVDAEAAFGRLSGVVRVAEEPAFEVEGRELDLASLLRVAGLELSLTGQADLSADIRFPAAGAEGPVTISARDGVLSHPSLPVDVPYQELDVELALGGDHTAEIVALELTSPMGTGSATGTIGRARVLERAPLQLQVDIQVAKNMIGVLRSQRVKVGNDGRITLTVRGTPSRPVVR